MTKIDFFLWGYVKDRMFQVPVTIRENMIERIREAFLSIDAEMLTNVDCLN